MICQANEALAELLQYIRKMTPQPPEYQRPDAEHTDRDDPEIGGGIEVLPEPLLLENRAAVPVDDIDKRIQFK